MFSVLDFIEKKRDNLAHSEDDIFSFIQSLLSRNISDYHLAAWLMAAYLNGLNDDEVMHLTKALACSGDVITYPDEKRVVDKHSTGGVGDKASIILVPLVASCGAKVSKLSGRGLGYTGGTVDKLESIFGMKLHLSADEFKSQLDKVGCVISGHSLELAPAEGILYRMRDVTGTINSIPLITSSIISKKIAGGAGGYVFDIKCGSGAFMKDEHNAKRLAENLVAVSRRLGKQCSAVISDMEQPLGEWVGNSAEVREAIEVLNGGGPRDTRELCIHLGAHMLVSSGVKVSFEEAFLACERALDNGAAFEKLKELVKAQGGSEDALLYPDRFLPIAENFHDIKAYRDGVVSKLDALSYGEALRALGGGRIKYDDEIDKSVAIRFFAKIGDRVSKDDTVVRIYYNTEERLKNALSYLNDSVLISDACEKRKLIIKTIL